MLRSISRNIRVLLAAQFVAMASLALAADPPSTAPLSARRLFAVGSDQMLWLSVAQCDSETGELAQRFYYRSTGTDRIYAAPFAPQLQEIHKAAVAGRTLYVFFRNRAHYAYTDHRAWRARQLPKQALPLALAGDTAGRASRLWAVVPADIGAEVDAQWRQQQLELAERPTTTAESSEPEPAPLRADLGAVSPTLQIVMYDGMGWQPGIEAPPECPDSCYIWLAIDDDRFHLFWVERDENSVVQNARYKAGKWTRGPAIQTVSPVERAVAAVINKQVVFAALLKEPDEQKRTCVQWTRAANAETASAWNQPPPLLDGEGKPLVLTDRTAPGLFGDRLALMSMAADKPSQVGFWLCATGGKPEQSFQPLPEVMAPDGAPTTDTVREFVTTIVVAGMLLLVFWRRQEAFGTILPPGLQVVGPGKRTLAFIVDATPAAIVVLLFWFDPLSTFYHEFRASTPARAAEPRAEVLWAWFWFRAIYTVWCTVFECLLSGTPGKRLLGCQVLSENLEPASLLQLGLRNVARMIELEPYLRIWPFLFVVFFTRNRQRMGDLLARTIVVERLPLALPDSERHTPPPSDE